MIYQGQNVEFIQLVSYMGEERKEKTFQENQKYFGEMIDGKLSFSCSYECPVEDMICVNVEDVIGNKFSEWEKGMLLFGLEELKEIFPNSFINLNLSGFVEEGNCIDLTGEQFKELYC